MAYGPFNSGGSGTSGSLTLAAVRIKTAPTKTAYKAGEVFDPAGMVVSADYAIDGIVVIEDQPTSDYTYPTTGLAAGTATVTISLTKNGTTMTAGQAVTVTKTEVPVPTSSGAKTFNGNTQTFSFNNEPSSAVATKTGDLSGMNVGSYTTRWTLNDTDLYAWADGSTDEYKEVTSVINKVTPTVTPPTKVSDMTYNGSSRALTATGGSTNFGTLQYSADGGSTWSTTRPAATNAGSYALRYRVVGDSNINDVASTSIGTVSIAKKAPTISVSPTSVTLNTSNLTKTATVTTDGDGSFATPTSSNTGVATATISNKTVTISHVNRTTGTATITVMQNEGTNYLGGSVTIAVTAQFISYTLNDNPWSVIGEVGQAGNGDTYWDVGDAKEITVSGKVGSYLTLSNQKMYPFIVDFNHKDNGTAKNGIMWMLGKSALSGGVVVGLYDSKYSPDASWAGYSDGGKHFTMNHSSNTNVGGWKGCDLRYDILGACSSKDADATNATISSPVSNTLMAALPSDLRAVMQLRTHYVDNTGNKSNTAANVTSVVDGMSPLAEYEIYGTRSYANQYEKDKQAQVAYYANGADKKVYKYNATGTALYVWECSPSYNYATDFCYVYTNGDADRANANRSLALAPAFLT